MSADGTMGGTETGTRAGARLQDRVVILTGAAGTIGSFISQHLLREGAKVVMTGRDGNKLDAFVDALSAEGFDRTRMHARVGDAADPEACRQVVQATLETFGRLDVLVNNAGGSGPKTTLPHIPITEDDARDAGMETMFAAAMNLLGGPWNMTRAAAPHMSANGSIINVSTIFSRTAYFGRIPYVVPKSGLNALSLGFARELGRGHLGLRVNTVFPGPIESERIDTVFAAMDQLQGQTPGTTSTKYRELMLHTRPGDDEGQGLRYPKPTDVASAITFLASDESMAFSGHAFEVTNGMQVPAQSRSKLVSWPDNRMIDLSDRVVLVLGGSDVDEALVFASRNRERGAEVAVAFRDLDAFGRARAKVQSGKHGTVRLLHLDPLLPQTVERGLRFMEDHYGRLDGVIVLPQCQNGEHGHSLATAEDADVEDFIRREIVGPVAFAAGLSRRLMRWQNLDRAPAVTFVTNPSDGRGNALNDVKRAAVEALLRVWREEERHAVATGSRPWACLPNQLVRFDNDESDNLRFSADWSATLTGRVRKMDAINLWVPPAISRATGKSEMPLAIQRVLPGLHQGKTAVITGGSLGIGYQLGRFLAIAGARVLLSARNEKRLAEARQAIVDELRHVGFSEPERRVQAYPGVDVGDEAALQRLHDHAIATFGHVDFLINNAGISGAEEMAVDMTLEAWNRTQEANLISNYSLIRKFAPGMKARGYGHILNVSSYFGGEKYLAVAYPNRSDYSVSKAGQRALAEILSRHLGPEIQINALAPGPVDGARLRGFQGAPGLFERRGLLILENKRLNVVHEALLAAHEEGHDVAGYLERLAVNELDDLGEWPDAPKAVQRLLGKIRDGRPQAVSTRFLVSGRIAPKLADRLVGSGVIDDVARSRFLDRFVEAPSPFFDTKDVSAAAEKIEAGIIDRLHLHKMPTDEQVGVATVFHLADEIVSGETFHPSGGLKFERSVTEGELMLSPGAEDLSKLKGRYVVLFGDAMREELVDIAQGFIAQGVKALALVARSQETLDALRTRMSGDPNVILSLHACGDDVEQGLRDAHLALGHVDVVVSTPFERLPLKALASDDGRWDRVLSRDDFANLMRDQITHHFRIAKVAALVKRCQIVLLTPSTSRASTREEFGLALFTKNTLHAFTVTLGVEGERLPTVPAVNQVQLTRRARSEEPGSEAELAEERKRMVAAVLQCSVPAPSPKESRYLARIFRGNAITA
ncbi:MAG: SDR family NAD(P)-dependent oxidoreductase [Myxococcota bacterium]